MAKPRRKATLHSAGRTTEADILARARELAEDPARAMPVCEHGCVWFSPVAAARRGILKAHAARDDEAKLQRLASRGNELARAYAATLLVARSEKIPFVADLKTPFGKVPYVIRGKAKPFQLAGLQHHDDRRLRLLAVTPWVKKRGLHFYSAGRGIVCTGRRARPPRDFVEEEMARLGLAARDAGVYVCAHGGGGADRDAVRLEWHAAGVALERCVVCADGGNTLHEILAHVAAPQPARGFTVIPLPRPLVVAAGAPPAVEASPAEQVLAQYRKGGLDDRQLVEAARQARTQALRARSERLYVAGDASYGDDTDAFLEALSPSEAERRALAAALAAHEGPVVLDRATAARALAELWPRHARTMLDAVGGSEVAVRLHRERAAPEEAADLVRRAAREGAASTALAGIPAYDRLPAAARAAHDIACAYRATGAAAAARLATEAANVPEARGVALAMLTSLGAAQGQEWRFTPVDRETAATLRSLVEALLGGDASRYHETLVAVSRRVGETDTFAPRPR